MDAPSGFLDFEQWRSIAQDNPDAAGRIFWEKLRAHSERARRSALVETPDEETFQKRFCESLEQAESDAPLRGIPYMLKDLFDVAGEPTTCGSKFLSKVRAKPDLNCTLQQLLVSRGGVYAGKTLMNEFACGLSGENAHYGDCPHPRFPEFLSGGSSSGSAWAVGGNVVPLAFGTDTGGSIRVPASFCGLFGMCLPPNRLSRDGVFPLSPTLDATGWFTASIKDLEESIQILVPDLQSAKEKAPVIHGHGGILKTSHHSEPVPETSNQKEHKADEKEPEHPPLLRGMMIDEVSSPLSQTLRREYLVLGRALEVERDSGFRSSLRAIFQECRRAFSVIQSREVFAHHKEWIDRYQVVYDPMVWKQINRGRSWKSFEIEQAASLERRLMEALNAFFKAYDFLAIPATTSPAPYKDELTPEFRDELLDLTAPASLGRLPVLTLPVFTGEGLSGGMQIITPRPDPAAFLQVIERSKPYYENRSRSKAAFAQ